MIQQILFRLIKIKKFLGLDMSAQIPLTYERIFVVIRDNTPVIAHCRIVDLFHFVSVSFP